MSKSRAKLTFVLLAAFFLAGAALSPARAQGTAGEIFKISDSGHFPAIVSNNRGGFVLAWTDIQDSNQEIYGGLLAPQRSIVSPLFGVNTQTAGIQTLSGIAAGPRGDFMVTWQGGTFGNPAGGDGDREGVFGQAFSRNGATLGGQRRLSQRAVNPQVDAIVAAREEGGYVAVWRDQGTGRFEILARRFTADGEPQGPEIPMKVGGEYNHVAGVAAYQGGFAVAWNEGFGCSGGRPDGSVGAIARFDSSGRRVGRVLRVGTPACGEGSGVVDLLESRAGMLAILLGPEGYSMQRFSPSGEPVGGQPQLYRRPLCSEDECNFIVSAAMDDGGRLAVLWEVFGPSTRTFFAQVFTPRGRPLTDRIPVGSTIPATLSSGSIALTNEGTIAVVWRRESVEAPEENGLYVWRYPLP